MKVAISKFTQLGLSENEAKAYITLLKENPLTAYEVAKSAAIPTSKIYEVVRKLESRQMVQAIHGEGSKLFVPIALNDFVQNYKSLIDNGLNTIKDELKGIKVGMDTSYTWHVKEYESLLLKVERMLKTADSTVLLSIWPAEFSLLFESLCRAEERGVNIAIIHYGIANMKVGQIYLHPIEDTIFERRSDRGFALIVDSKEALTGKVAGSATEAIWSMNEGFVMMAEDYLRHDIYFIKTARRFAPILQERFGKRYEKLMDIYSDDEMPRS